MAMIKLPGTKHSQLLVLECSLQRRRCTVAFVVLPWMSEPWAHCWALAWVRLSGRVEISLGSRFGAGAEVLERLVSGAAARLL